jgi:hypothetical protein
MSNVLNTSLPVARPIYGDVEAIEIVPLIETTDHCMKIKKTIYDICTCFLCTIVLFGFLFYMFFIL